MRQFGKYLLVGLANTGLGYTVIFTAMYIFGISAVGSNAIGYAAGMVISYVMNGRFTFTQAALGGTSALRFVLVSVIAYLVNLVVLILLIQTVLLNEALSQILAGTAYVLTTFFVNKHYVFRSQSRAGAHHGKAFPLEGGRR